MKKIVLLLCAMCWICNVSAQIIRKEKGLNELMGTWVYQKNDTVFKIQLLDKCAVTSTFEEKEFDMQLWGNYYLSVKGKVIEDNLNLRTQFPNKLNIRKKKYPANLLGLRVRANEPPTIYTTTFYDKQKKHYNGYGIVAGNISLLSPTKIHWTLNEEAALFETGIAPIGFSVPIDVIMTKEE